MKRGEESQQRHEGAGREGRDRKYSEGSRIGPPTLLSLSAATDVRVCWVRGLKGGMDGRGGEGVGGNWRGVALTHQATVYKNKKLWAGEMAQSFLYIFSLYQKDCENKQK